MSGGAMSIFDPIVPDRRSADLGTIVDEWPSAESVPGPPSRGRSFDPRSIQIAGLITVGLVVLGILVSNAAKPDPGPRPGLASRVEPGAAAVEQVDLAPNDVSQGANDEPADLPGDVVDGDEDSSDGQSSDSSSDGDPWRERWQERRDRTDRGHKAHSR